MHQSLKIMTVLFFGAFAGLTSLGTAANAQLYNPCPYTNDGDCDEPNGLGYCAWGTDTADCSNPNSNFGSGSGYGSSPAGGGSTGGGLMNPCPYTNDGDCDEPNGLGYCAWGTDTADCSNPNSNYGSGSGYTGHGGSTAGGGAIAGGGGGGGGAISTYYPWRTFTRQIGQFAAQPANSTPLSPNGGMYYQPGAYTVFTGIVRDGQIHNIQTFGVSVMPDQRYLAAASSMGSLSFRTDASLIMYSPPTPGMAMIYGRNDDIQNDRAICILPSGWAMSQC